MKHMKLHEKQVSAQNLECGDKSRAVRGSRHRFLFALCAKTHLVATHLVATLSRTHLIPTLSRKTSASLRLCVIKNCIAICTPLRHCTSALKMAAGVFLLVAPCSFAASPSDSARAFLWEQAGAQAAAATTPDAYLQAAATYNRLVADGVCNGPLFQNLGGVLVMAGDGVNAAAAFERAERYLGVTPETRQGLAAALALQTGRAQAELPWSRTAFFWHYAFPCSVRAATALAGWSLFWLGVFFRLLRRRGIGRAFLRSLSETCLLTGGLLTVVFSASVLMTLTNERHDEATWGARIFTASAIETEVGR